jgi:Sec-independent protein translocase protein TatA
LEVAVLAWMLGRELAIILVIALLAVGGSQLPKLVRALGEASAAPKKASADDAEGEPGPRSPGT